VGVDIVFAVQTCDTRSSLWWWCVRCWGGGLVERGDRNTNLDSTKGSLCIFRLYCYILYIYHQHDATVGRSCYVAFHINPKYYPTRIKKDLVVHHYTIYICEPRLIYQSLIKVFPGKWQRKHLFKCPCVD